MRKRVISLLMLFFVIGALILSLRRDLPADAPLAAALPITCAPTAAPSPIESYRARRKTERAREQAALLSLGEDGDAKAQLLEINRCAEIELAVEAALAARGDGDGLCAVRGNQVTVVLGRPLDEREAAMIVSIAAEASGLTEDCIRLWAF